MRRNQGAETERLPRYREFLLVSGQLEEQSRVRPTLVNLPSRVKETRAIAHGRRNLVPFHNLLAQLGKSGINAAGLLDVGHDGEVVARPRLLRQGADGPIRFGPRQLSLLSKLVQYLAGGVLCSLNVGLIEGVNVEQGTCNRGCELPAEELAAQVVRALQLEPDDRMADRRKPLRGHVDRCVVVAVEPQVHEHAIVAVDVGIAQRLARHRDNAASLLASALREELLGPQPEACNRGRCHDG